MASVALSLVATLGIVYGLSTGFMELVAGLSALEAGLWLVAAAIALALVVLRGPAPAPVASAA